MLMTALQPRQTNDAAVANRAGIADYDDITEEYRDAIWKAYDYGIVQGKDENHTFGPQDILTRAQMAAIFARAGWTDADGDDWDSYTAPSLEDFWKVLSAEGYNLQKGCLGDSYDFVKLSKEDAEYVVDMGLYWYDDVSLVYLKYDNQDNALQGYKDAVQNMGNEMFFGSCNLKKISEYRRRDNVTAPYGSFDAVAMTGTVYVIDDVVLINYSEYKNEPKAREAMKALLSGNYDESKVNLYLVNRLMSGTLTADASTATVITSKVKAAVNEHLYGDYVNVEYSEDLSGDGNVAFISIDKQGGWTIDDEYWDEDHDLLSGEILTKNMIGDFWYQYSANVLDPLSFNYLKQSLEHNGYTAKTYLIDGKICVAGYKDSYYDDEFNQRDVMLYQNLGKKGFVMCEVYVYESPVSLDNIVQQFALKI
jgi:hypothetical protein